MNSLTQPSKLRERGNPSKVYTLKWIASHSFAMTVLLFYVLTISPLKAQISGFDEMGKDLQEMQMNDAANPAFLWVKEGEKLFQADCKSCHDTLKGVSGTFPKFHEGSKKIVSLDEQISYCRVTRGLKDPLKEESRQALALESFIALQSRGAKIAAHPYEKEAKLGEQFFTLRQGQLNLSCANCHVENAGKKLFSAHIPEGHSNGYPQYRLEWQSLGSLKRRLRNCLVGVRAEIPPRETLINLELYLKTRAVNLRLESPAIRP